MKRKDGWTPVTADSPDRGAVLTCWGNSAIGVSHRSRGEWYASVQVATEPNGLAMILKLNSPPSHWRPLPGAPQETWDGPDGDWPAWG